MSTAVIKSALLLCSIVISNLLSAQNKYALIVAAGKYKAWPQISSLNDVPYIRSALTAQGFTDDKVTVIADEAVTMEGLRKAFTDLTKKVSPGDIVVIHFSAHGEQVADNDQDETDGLDESIVTYDAAFPVNRDHFEKDQAAYFRDDEFGKYMDQLRARLGSKGDLLVILDACHSGTGTRGEHKVRGGQPALVPKDFKPQTTTGNGDPEVFMNKGTDAADLSSYVIISGAQATELNSEMSDSAGVSMGSLSFAISEALVQLKPGTTYRSLFADIISAMNRVVPEQHPVLEGNGLDRELFGGRYVEQKPFAGIVAMNGKEYTLDQGQMSGIESGAGVALYPKGTIDPEDAKPLATGKVKSSTAYQSVVTWDKDPGLEVNADGWVFVTSPVYKIPPVILATVFKGRPSGFSAAETAQIQKEVAALPLIKMTGSPELILRKGEEKDSLILAANGFLFGTFHVSNAGELTEILKRYSQYKYLQQVSLKDPLSNMQVSIIPVVDGKPAPEAIGKYMKNGLPEFRPDDVIVIRVKNSTDVPLYINILDMQPDGKINAIFPNKGRNITAGSLIVAPGSDHTFSDFPVTIGPPFGLETFKIFISRTEIDMESIAEMSGASSRSGLGPLQDLLNSSYGISTRGENTPSPKASGSAFNLLFRIVK